MAVLLAALYAFPVEMLPNSIELLIGNSISSAPFLERTESMTQIKLNYVR